MADQQYIWRVVVERYLTVPNPKYRYYDRDSNEPRYLTTDQTREEVSKIWMRKADAKRYRTVATSHGDPALVKSAVIQKAEIVWQNLAEDEL